MALVTKLIGHHRFKMGLVKGADHSTRLKKDESE